MAHEPDIPSSDIPSPDTSPIDGSWPPRLEQARLHFVSGKGGTGKSTVASALALAIAAAGKRVLLMEVENRQGIAPIFDTPDLPYAPVQVATAEGGGVVFGEAVDAEASFLQYLKSEYNMGLAAHGLRRIGAIDFVTTLAPGLKDIFITGKIMDCVQQTNRDGTPVWDAVVVDAPPTGRIGKFLDVAKAMRDLAKAGPISTQSDRVVQLLHSPSTVVHLVTLLESLPVQESAEAARELVSLDLRVGALIINRSLAPQLPDAVVDAVADGEIDAQEIRETLSGLSLTDHNFAGLLTETIDYARTVRSQKVARASLNAVATTLPDVRTLELPQLPGGVDLGGLYDLSELLIKAGAK